MPKVEIDYSNTIFYKIYCVNPEITDMYIGHTTNFVQRKHGHKQSCTNNKNTSYNCKLYNYIREHGGWNNWIMEIIAFRNCEDHYSARKCEQEYFKEYNATLNSIEPLPIPKIKKDTLYCNTCNIYFTTTTLHEVHNKTNKHIKRLNLELIGNNIMTSNAPKNVNKYICKKCDYHTSRLRQYDRHLLTAKHKMMTNNGMKPTKAFVCKDCGNEYKYRQGLSVHRKKCQKTSKPNNINLNDNRSLDNLDRDYVLTLIKQNNDFKDLLVESNQKTAELQQQLVDAVKNNITNNN